MKVCPVCQYEEEQDSETSCAICGSDLEGDVGGQAEEPIVEDSSIEDKVEPELAKDDSSVSSSVEEQPSSESVTDASDSTDEEKALEEMLEATEVSSEDKKSGLSSFFLGFFTSISNLGSNFTKMTSGLDAIFKTDGKINYKAPLVLVVVSILLFFAVIGLAVTTVPGPTDESSDGYQPTTPYYKGGIRIGTGVSEPFSGEPFNCEIWDGQRYSEFSVNVDGRDMFVTDINQNGTVDNDERFGCMVNMSWGSGLIFFGLNVFLIICIFYFFNLLDNTSIINPIAVFGGLQLLLFLFYGGLMNQLIYPLTLTVGLVCTIGLIVSTSVLLTRTSLGRPLEDPPSATFYLFIVAAALLLSSIFLNYAQGPYLICEAEYSRSELEEMTLNLPEDQRSPCQTLGYRNMSVIPLYLQGGDNMILLMAASFLFIGVGNWLVSNTRINDIDEAKYFSMIISGLVLQFLILVYNVLTTDDGGLGMDENDTTLTVMALGITTLGMISFYRKRRGDPGSMGVAYFGIFAAGIFALFGTFITPVILGGNDAKWPEDTDSQFNLVLSAFVTAIGFWLFYKFGSQKLREMSLASDAAMPNRQDPFTPTVPGQQSAMPEWSVDSAMEFLMQEYGEEFQIELKHTTEHTPDIELVEKTMMDKVDQSVEIRPAIDVDYNVKFEEIAEAYSTTRDTVDEVITHLTSGKNIMLFGEPGTGKTALSNILLTKLCGEIDQPNGSKAPNYTIVTANAEWSNFDVIGGISPDDSGGYYFKDGYVAEAAKLCEHSIRERGKPHYLVIDEFNRANIDEAFGKLFTVFEYRDKQPLLTHKETGGAPFMMPPEFRIIGTMNTQDKNTLFNVGFALMRRFAFVEIGLPLPDDEYNRMPVFVYFKLKKLGLVPERPEGDILWKFGEKCKHFPSRKFDFYDDDGHMYNCHEKLVKFLAPDEPPKRGEEAALGVRTFRKIGPALLIDSMVTIFNSIQKYGPELALDKVIRSNIMPSLEGLERNEIRCMFLKAKEVLGPDSMVTETLDRMANSDSLSLF